MVFFATVPVYRMHAAACVLIPNALAQHGFVQNCSEAFHRFCLHLAGSQNLTRMHVNDNDDYEQNDTECMQILADAIKAQTAELRASVDSMKEMLNKYEQSRSSPSKDGVSMAELRQELLTFANNLNE